MKKIVLAFTIAFLSLGSSNAQNLFPTTSGSKAGIGTTTPNASLEVRKQLSSSVNSPIGLSVKGTSQYTIIDSGVNEHTYIRGGKGNSNVLINDYSGSGVVGIGVGVVPTPTESGQAPSPTPSSTPIESGPTPTPTDIPVIESSPSATPTP